PAEPIWSVAVVVPPGELIKSPVFPEGGVMLTDAPVPLRLTVCGEPDALSATVRVPYREPLAVGVKVMEMVQLAPAATLDPQVFVSVKSPATATELMASAA